MACYPYEHTAIWAICLQYFNTDGQASEWPMAHGPWKYHFSNIQRFPLILCPGWFPTCDNIDKRPVKQNMREVLSVDGQSHICYLLEGSSYHNLYYRVTYSQWNQSMLWFQLLTFWPISHSNRKVSCQALLFPMIPSHTPQEDWTTSAASPKQVYQ